MSDKLPIFYTSRSASICYQTCPRSYMYQYLWQGKGLSPKNSNINLHLGSCVHHGLQQLLEGHDIESSLSASQEAYWKPIQDSSPLTLEQGENADYVNAEQWALIEGLLRAYSIIVLPALKARFNILETEREDLFELTRVTLNNPLYLNSKTRDIALYDVVDVPVLWQSRADGLLEEKVTGDLYVLSFKTAKMHTFRNEQEARIDMQGLSECAAINARLEGWYELSQSSNSVGIPQWFLDKVARNGGSCPRVTGVKMEYLIKGKREEYPKGSHHWTQDSPLIRPWKKVDGEKTSYAHSWKWADDIEIGRNHTLGKSWKKVNIWEPQEMGVKAWIEELAQGGVQPEAGDCLENQFVLPPEYFRNDEDILSWKTQMIAQHREILEGQNKYETSSAKGASLEERVKELDTTFRQHRRSCLWPSKCVFNDVCWEFPRAAKVNPEQTGQFAVRVSHHLPEKEYLEDVD